MYKIRKNKKKSPTGKDLSKNKRTKFLIWTAIGFSIGFQTGFLYFPRFAKNPVFLNKNTGGKKPEIRILFLNFSESFFLKCTCTRTHDNINLFLRETQNVENRKPNYFHLL
jgi:hypothetical protein